MTTEQRLTTVENDLEAVKTLLFSSASYAESANRGLDRLAVKVDDLTAAQDRTQAQLDQLGARFDQLGFRVDQLVESQTQTIAQLDRLGTRIEQLVELQAQSQAFVNSRLDRIERTLEGLLSSQATEREAREALREDTQRAISQLTQDLTANVEDLVGMISQLAQESAQDKAEIRRIWEYLLRQSGNGDRPS